MIYKQCNISEVTTYDDCTEQAYKDQLDQGVGAVGIRNFGGNFAGVIEIFYQFCKENMSKFARKIIYSISSIRQIQETVSENKANF